MFAPLAPFCEVIGSAGFLQPRGCEGAETRRARPSNLLSGLGTRRSGLIAQSAGVEEFLRDKPTRGRLGELNGVLNRGRGAAASGTYPGQAGTEQGKIDASDVSRGRDG